LQFAPKKPVPVFPLPNLVLFPHTSIPLHIFELRYRTMIREALSSERLLTLALLKPGWEDDYRGNPPFHSLACLARIDDIEWLPNDCYDLRVLGLSRVKIGRVTREFPYRAAIVELCPHAPLTDSDPLVELEKRALIDACARWSKVPPLPGETPPAAGLGEGLSYEQLVNAACMGVHATPGERLELLALDSVIDRGQRVREKIERRLQLRTPPPPRAASGEN
jgi:Lon protease-like protein